MNELKVASTERLYKQRQQPKWRSAAFWLLAPAAALLLPMYGQPAYSDESQESAQKWVFIDTTGNIKLKGYEEAAAFSDGLAAVKIDGKWGYIDKVGKLVIPALYESVTAFSEGVAAVQLPSSLPDGEDFRGSKAGAWGFINKTGKFVIKATYNYADHFSDGLAAVRDDSGPGSAGQWEFIDHDGKVAIKGRFEAISSFSEGLKAVMKIGPLSYSSWGEDFNIPDKQWYFIDKTGKTVLTPGMSDQGQFFEGAAAVRLGRWQGYSGENDWSFIDKSGKLTMKPIFSRVHRFSEGLAAVETVKWQDLGQGIQSAVPEGFGYMDHSGNTVISARYEEADPFSGGYASVRVNGLWGYIDKSGKMAIAPKYPASGAFSSEGLAPVELP